MLPSKSTIEILKLSPFDSMEFKAGTFLNKEFPVHFHTDWSLALIESGSEIINFDKLEIQLSADVLILIPPFLPHANRGNFDSIWSYKAVYFNLEAVDYIIKTFCEQKIYAPQLQTYIVSYDKSLINKFKQLYYDKEDKAAIEFSLAHIFAAMYDANVFIETNTIKNDQKLIGEILSFLGANFEKRITLNDLSSQFAFDKFKLLRKFKSFVGLTPQEYITSLRIENSKKQMFEEIPLLEIAINAGFYDQSHFSNCFKKYVGLAPDKYRQVCNILQDKGNRLT